MIAPRFSVVILLPNARGLAADCVHSWVTQGEFARDRFELVLVTDDHDAELDTSVRPLLCANDQLLHYPGATRTALYDHGARAARGEFVVLTESHCIAERTFLRELDHYLLSTGAPGACCRGLPIPGDTLSTLAAEAFEFGYQRYRQPDDWRKVNIHACAIRRDYYLNAGGLNPRYGMFAEMLLADELWHRGHRMGFAERAIVRHCFDGSAAESIEFNTDAVSGEMRYYSDHPRAVPLGHTFLADGDSPWSACELEWAAFAALRSDWPQMWALACRQGWRALKFSLKEGRLGRMLNRLEVHLCAALCRKTGANSARGMRLYLRSWTAAARLARKLALIAKSPQPAPESGLVSITIDELAERDMWGFHLPERWQGLPFRWTGRCAVMRLPRPRAGELVLQTHELGWQTEKRLRSVHVDGQRLPTESVTFESNAIRVKLGPAARSGPLLLTLVCDPVPPEVCGSEETRELGIPLFEIAEPATRALVRLRAAA